MMMVDVYSSIVGWASEKASAL